jgi:hypothetical protein
MPKPGQGADDIAKTVFGDAIREIAKALWQLSYAMFIFAGYLIFGVRWVMWPTTGSVHGAATSPDLLCNCPVQAGTTGAPQLQVA